MAALGAGALVLAACGGGSDSDDDGSASGATGEIDRSAGIVYAISVAPTSLDPHGPTGQGLFSGQTYFPIYDRLTMIGTPEDPNAQGVTPMLAESWDYSDDGLTFTLTLRDDVTFNDGTPVTAEAVKASLDRAKESQYIGTVLNLVESVEVVDEQTVQLNLSEPDGALPAVLGTSAGVVINPAVLNYPGVDLNLEVPRGAGSGPYVVAELEPGVSMTLERADDDYWDEDAGQLERIELVGVSEATTRISGLQAGDYDLVFLASLQVSEGQRLAQGGQFQTHVATGRTPAALVMRPSAPSISDPRVRQAIAHAVDREGIAQGALNGSCDPIEQLIPEGILGHVEGYENPYPYDPDQARALLDEAGATNVSFQAVFPVGSTQDTVAQAMQAQLEEVGITMQPVGVPPADSITTFNNQNLPATVNGIPGEADPALFVDSALFSRTPVGLEIPELADLAAQARAEVDPDAREELYEQINEIAMDEGLIVPVCTAQFAWTGRSDLVGLDRMGLNWASAADLRYVGVTS